MESNTDHASKVKNLRSKLQSIEAKKPYLKDNSFRLYYLKEKIYCFIIGFTCLGLLIVMIVLLLEGRP